MSKIKRVWFPIIVRFRDKFIDMGEANELHVFALYISANRTLHLTNFTTNEKSMVTMKVKLRTVFGSRGRVALHYSPNYPF